MSGICDENQWKDLGFNDPPEDGKPVLITYIRERNGKTQSVVLRASYIGKFMLLASDDEFGEYDEATDEYYCPEGWYETNEFEETNWSVCGEVVAWMPLPEPAQ